jgi:hypothetical protein
MTITMPKSLGQDRLESALESAQAGDLNGVRAYVRAASSEWKSSAERGQRATVAAAYATFAAIQGGYLFMERASKDEVRPEGWVGPTEFGRMFPKTDRSGGIVVGDDGEPVGMSKATISTWAIAGRAYEVHGVDPESKEGKALLNRYGQAKEVTEVVKRDSMTLEDLQAAITAADEAAAARKAKRQEEAAQRNTEDVTTVPASNSAKLDLMETVLASLGQLSPVEAKRLADLAQSIDLVLERPMLTEEQARQSA